MNRSSLLFRALRFVYHTPDRISEYRIDRDADKRLEHLAKLPKKEKIRVGFLVQLPEVWDKQNNIYMEMKKREDIETLLLVAPPYDYAKKKIVFNYEGNYYLNNYDDAVKIVDDEGKAYDFKQFGVDYLFIERKGMTLPSGWCTELFSETAKVCYVSYGYTCAKEFLTMKKENERYYYFIPEDVKENYDLHKEMYSKQIKKGIKHIELIGYPEFEHYLRDEHAEKKTKQILWTPRWSYDDIVGGSHFIEYHSHIEELAKKYPDVKVVIRPHPLMFDNFVRQGIMTEAEVASFKNRINDVGISLRLGGTLKEDLLETDILITDFSSIMMMYCMTGKPMIYCNGSYDFTDEMNEMLKGVYVADNWENVEEYVDRLLCGDDKYQSMRKTIIENKLNMHKQASQNIVDWIVKDGILV